MLRVGSLLATVTQFGLARTDPSFSAPERNTMPSSLLTPPHLVLLLAILLPATVIDLREHRIPNLLSLGGAALGLLLAASGFGAVSILQALAGLAVGLLCLLPLHLKRVMGAGDVKLMAAVGSFIGPLPCFLAVLCTFIAGGVLGMAVLIHRDGLRETTGRYYFGIKHLIVGGDWLGSRIDRDGTGPLRFPYATAISSGTVAAILWSAGMVN